MRFILFLIVATFLARGPLPAAESVYIGTYTTDGSQGIYLASFDAKTGTLSNPALVAETKDPSFVALHPSKPYLYAVNEGSASVSAFQITPGTGKLVFLNSQPTKGAAPCHLAVDATGRMLAVANYTGGSIAAYPIGADGKLGESSAFVQFTGTGADKERQEGPHAHSTTFTPDNRFLFTNDLGTDRTMIFRVHPETAKLEAATPPSASGDPGSGPRHLAISPDKRFVYVLNEVASSVTRFAFNPSKPSLTKMDTVSALPADFKGSNTGAEIQIDAKGKTLYASNRGDDSIAVFHIDADGTLHLIQNAPSGGKEPRSFTLDPAGQWLLAANQKSSNVAILRVGVDGKLTPTGQPVTTPTPVCLLFVHAHSH